VFDPGHLDVPSPRRCEGGHDPAHLGMAGRGQHFRRGHIRIFFVSPQSTTLRDAGFREVETHLAGALESRAARCPLGTAAGSQVDLAHHSLAFQGQGLGADQREARVE
jgi:hypothetical protein